MAIDDVRLDISGLDRLLATEPGRVEEWLEAFAESVLTDIVLSFGTSPAAPGDPPGVDTGTLRASMRREKTGALEQTISDGVEYGIYLEDGTERIAPRPFVRPAFERARARVEKDARANLDLENF